VVPDKRTENEAVFRAANERLRERVSELDGEAAIPFICECSDANCLEVVELTLPAYEDVRLQGEACFFVLPGHNGDGERVVRESDGFMVVEKFEREAA
jgi:hypothetical protein